MAPKPSTQRPYGGRSAPERRSERRERLLDAGLELFGTAGYAGTTIEALCGASALNPRYFYEHFRNREQLLGAVYERHVEAVLQTVRSALEAAGRDPATRLHAGLTAFVQATLADERGARINYFEMVGVSPRLEAQRRRVLSAYAELIAAEATGADAGAAVGSRAARGAGAAGGAGAAEGSGDPRMTAVALVGATDGLITDWLSGDRRRPRSAIVDTLLTIFAPIVAD